MSRLEDSRLQQFCPLNSTKSANHETKRNPTSEVHVQHQTLAGSQLQRDLHPSTKVAALYSFLRAKLVDEVWNDRASRYVTRVRRWNQRNRRAEIR